MNLTRVLMFLTIIIIMWYIMSRSGVDSMRFHLIGGVLARWLIRGSRLVSLECTGLVEHRSLSYSGTSVIVNI